MPTPKQLAIRALERTTDAIVREAGQIPANRWQESPAEGANDLFGILLHLIECELWWRMNIGIAKAEFPQLPRPGDYQAAQEMLDAFVGARRDLIRLLGERPDGFFENPVPEIQYGNLQSGAELFLYAAEHDFYHVGQICTLQMAFAEK